MNPILQALLAARGVAQSAAPPQTPPMSLGFQSPFVPQPQPIQFAPSPMQDPQGDMWRQEQEAAQRAQMIEQIRSQIEQTRMQMAETANKPVKRKPALDKKEALIGGGIAALAALLGARPQYLNPAIQQYIGTKEQMADQQYQQDAQAQQQQAAVLQAKLANESDRLTDAQRAEARSFDLADKRTAIAREDELLGKKGDQKFQGDLLKMMQYVPAEYRPFLGAQLGLPAADVLGAPTAKEINQTADASLKGEKANELRLLTPERQAKIKADRELSQTRAKAVLTGMKLDEARTAQILKDVEWADAEYSSKIAAREAAVQISRDNLNVKMRGQDMAQGRFDATQAMKAQEDHKKKLKDLRSPVEKQLQKLESERAKLNAKLAQQQAEGDDDAAEQTSRELILNGVRANAAAKRLYDIDQEMAGASTDPNAPANPFGGGMNIQGPIGGARGTTPRERGSAPTQKPTKASGKVVRQGSLDGAKFTIREK